MPLRIDELGGGHAAIAGGFIVGAATGGGPGAARRPLLRSGRAPHALRDRHRHLRRARWSGSPWPRRWGRCWPRLILSLARRRHLLHAGPDHCSPRRPSRAACTRALPPASRTWPGRRARRRRRWRAAAWRAPPATRCRASAIAALLMLTVAYAFRALARRWCDRPRADRTGYGASVAARGRCLAQLERGPALPPAEVVRPRDREELAAAIVAAAEAGRTVSVVGSRPLLHRGGDDRGHDDRRRRAQRRDRRRSLLRPGQGRRRARCSPTSTRSCTGSAWRWRTSATSTARPIAGAISTGTHGTGAKLRNISAQVEADGAGPRRRQRARARTGTIPTCCAPRGSASAPSARSRR